MTLLLTNGLYLHEENIAEPEVAQIFDAFKQKMQIPFVPNLLKAIAASPPMLNFFWDFWSSSIRNRTIPEALFGMIGYAISSHRNCRYCAANSELTCRRLGVDDETLAKLVKDLGNVNPQRVRAIMEFALKVANNAQSLVKADYDNLRDQGVTEDEIIEIIMAAATGLFLTVVADTLQIEVDGEVTSSLENFNK